MRTILFAIALLANVSAAYAQDYNWQAQENWRRLENQRQRQVEQMQEQERWNEYLREQRQQAISNHRLW